jgi:diguanylate cyclase (GGDEF)-like protein
VISLKKYLDMEMAKPAASAEDLREVLPVILESYRAALRAMGANGNVACSAVGAELQQNLALLEGRLAEGVTAAAIQQTEKEAEEYLGQWGERSAEYFKAKTKDVKDLLVAMARTAQSVGERDKKYTDQFTKFTSQLQSIADLEDLTQVRASLVQGAKELKLQVDRMTEDNQSLVKQLKTEVSTYEVKLKAAEELVLRDSLTGLSNRRNVEERIELRIARGQTFCVAILDVDKFKQVNDTYGHQAGDSLLRQFAAEVRSSVRAVDTAGRWGGDEFIIVLDCDLTGAKVQIERTKKWVFGEYKIQVGADTAETRVKISASIGLAEWQMGETMKDVIEHADAAMYAEKEAARKGEGK